MGRGERVQDAKMPASWFLCLTEQHFMAKDHLGQLSKMRRGASRSAAGHSRLWNFDEAMARMTMAMPHSTAACCHSSSQPPPRRMTPREASIIHVVGMIWARYQKKVGIESSGKTYPERKMDGMT